MIEPISSGEAAYIAIGSNLGESYEHLLFGVNNLSSIGRVIARSSIYQTVPVGGPQEQSCFLNALVIVEPIGCFKGQPERILKVLLDIEHRRGRIRDTTWGPRTLDLDLICLGDLVVNKTGLKVPHPRMMDRAFVLTPLCEVDSEWTHPITGDRACEVLIKLDTSGVVRTELSWRKR